MDMYYEEAIHSKDLSLEIIEELYNDFGGKHIFFIRHGTSIAKSKQKANFGYMRYLHDLECMNIDDNESS